MIARVFSSPHGWLGALSLQQRASLFWKSPSSRSYTLSSSSILCDKNHHQSAASFKAEAFIEEKLTDALSEKARSVRQIVLLTDGEDHISCGLQWPPLTVIFQVSSYPGFQVSEVPKSSLVRNVDVECAESEELTDRLRNAGYQGNKPSVWVVQGINLEAETKLRRVLANVSSLIMQGSLVIGSLKASIGELNEDAAKNLLEKILLGCGFRRSSVMYTTSLDGMAACILFAAEQLRLSDDQVHYARREMELAEESGEEETFEDWL
ncbi:hypothetical protein GOP47_0005918 [Adiantum capillus-veneris]|uniref:Uncharacterized protein n=1 Tax=Adiantum capillus-veneris TaxID=13818 RepID=A0A9D4ZLJ5_ADICA|nr:hypothetical protein GOP47_0005918 [Adiantum capillus-veneris]